MKHAGTRNKFLPSAANPGWSRSAAVEPSWIAQCSFSSSFIFLSFCSILLTLTLRDFLLFDLLVDLAPVYASSSAYNTPVRFLLTWRNYRQNIFHARTGRIIWATRKSRSRSRVQCQPFERQVSVRVRDKAL